MLLVTDPERQVYFSFTMSLPGPASRKILETDLVFTHSDMGRAEGRSRVEFQGEPGTAASSVFLIRSVPARTARDSRKARGRAPGLDPHADRVREKPSLSMVC